MNVGLAYHVDFQGDDSAATIAHRALRTFEQIFRAYAFDTPTRTFDHEIVFIFSICHGLQFYHIVSTYFVRTRCRSEHDTRVSFRSVRFTKQRRDVLWMDQALSFRPHAVLLHITCYEVVLRIMRILRHLLLWWTLFANITYVVVSYSSRLCVCFFLDERERERERSRSFAGTKGEETSF